MINLGTKVKDKITGLTGIVVARTEFINGCVQYEVQPHAKKDGTVPEALGIDEQTLDIITKKKLKIKPKKKPPGGRMSKPTKMRGF